MIVIAAAAPDDAALWASTADTADGASNEARLVVVLCCAPMEIIRFVCRVIPGLAVHLMAENEVHKV